MKKTIKILSTAMLISGSVSSVFGTEATEFDRHVATAKADEAHKLTGEALKLYAQNTLGITGPGAKMDYIKSVMDKAASKNAAASTLAAAGAPAEQADFFADLGHSRAVDPLTGLDHIAALPAAQQVVPRTLEYIVAGILHAKPELADFTFEGKVYLAEAIVDVLSKKDVVLSAFEKIKTGDPAKVVEAQVELARNNLDDISAHPRLLDNPFAVFQTVIGVRADDFIGSLNGAHGPAFTGASARPAGDNIRGGEIVALDINLLRTIENQLKAAQH